MALFLGLDEIRCDWYVGDEAFGPRLGELQYVPDISNFLPHFRLYEVVSLHMSILPYKYRKILEMLPKLMKRLARDWESFSTFSARPHSIDLDVLGASLTARTRNCLLLVHVFYHNPYSRITFNQMQCNV